MEVDIEDCPVADVPLTEIFDTVNSVLINDYLVVLKMYIAQQLEDTIFLMTNQPLHCLTPVLPHSIGMRTVLFSPCENRLCNV